MSQPARSEGAGIEVVLESLETSDRPSCPHGPTILFERYSQDRKTARRYYACSSCRDRKQCGFFQNEGEKVSEAAKQAREDYISKTQPPFSHREYYSRYEDILKLPVADRSFCRQCHLLLKPLDRKEHKGHVLFTGVTDVQLSAPTQLMMPLENKKYNAQYLFSKKTVKFVVDMIEKLGYTRVLCLGTPSVHEAIRDKHSVLLDIDHRYEQFYDVDHFARYNMFNNHFFEGQKSIEDFVQAAESERMCVLIDPPFGGLVDVLAHTLKHITDIWKKTQTGKASGTEGDLPIFWFFPYFMEPRITQAMPNMAMLDYKVDYINHESFQEGPKGRKHGSPVRIFTNVSLSTVRLPEDEGYRYCGECCRYVSDENVHCKICKACTSKDGKTYIHCDMCERCVKPSRVHCFKCQQCLLPEHRCGEKPSAGCHICGDLTHKRRDCPQKDIQKEKLKRKNEMPDRSPDVHSKKQRRPEKPEKPGKMDGNKKGKGKFSKRKWKVAKGKK